MKGLQKLISILGRICLSLIFILSAIKKIFDWQTTESGLINLLCDWQSYIHSNYTLQKAFANLVTWVPEILIVATILELVGGLLVFFGLKVRFGAFLLLVFFVTATILLHPFWFVDGSKRDLQIVMFLKNLAIIGGLLYVLAYGNKSNSSKVEHFEEHSPTIQDDHSSFDEEE